MARSDNKIGGYCRRLKARLGKAEGIVATAHSRAERDSQPPGCPAAQRRGERRGAARSNLARIIHGMIFHQRAYDENEAFKVTPSSQAHRLQHLHKQAAKLGFQLVPAT